MFSIQRKFYEQTVACTPQAWKELTESEQVRTTVAAARECLRQQDRKGYDARKRALPLACFMATFGQTVSKSGLPGHWRKQQAARLNGLVMLDVDHVADPRQVFDNIPHHMFDEACAVCIYLVHITPSGQGLRIVFRADPQRGNLSDNQHYMAQILGVACDEACKDASRGSFVPAAADVLYLNERLFDYDNPAYDQLYGDAYRGGRSAGAATDGSDGEKPEPPAANPSDYHGVAMEKIVAAWLEQHGTPAVGDRHRTLLKLAGDLRYICDNRAAAVRQAVRTAPFVKAMDDEGGSAEVDRVCDDACGQRMWRELPKRMAGVLEAAGVAQESGDGEGAAADSQDYGDAGLTFWRQMEQHVSGPYADAVAGVQDENKVGAIFAAGAMFCTLMTRTWYRHYDGQPHRMNPQVYIIGDPASGKSFADVLDRSIMAAMRHADLPAREAEERYKREQKERTTSSKAQKGEALAQPQGVIRYIPSRTSNAVFYRRAVNAKEAVDNQLMPLHLYTFDSELDSSITAQSGGTWIGKHDLELKAFHNELSGVDYANADSVNQLIPVYWNQVVTGTPLSLAKKITLRNINDGLCSRIAVFRMANSHYEMIGRCTAGTNHEREVALKKWGFYFEGLKGELKIERLIDHVYGLCEQSAEVARLADDLVLDYLRKRAVFYATWFTIPQMAGRLRGQAGKTLADIEVTDDDLRLATAVYDAVLYYQDRMFGQMLLDSWENAKREFQPRRRNSRYAEAYRQLPEAFTPADVEQLLGVSKDAARKHCLRWEQSGYAERIKYGVYKKIIKDIQV